NDPNSAYRLLGGPITDASNTAPIVITSANHALTSGQQVVISGVIGNTAANNNFPANPATWTITVIDANTFSLTGSTGTRPYTAGGPWRSLSPTGQSIPFPQLALRTATPPPPSPPLGSEFRGNWTWGAYSPTATPPVLAALKRVD